MIFCILLGDFATGGNIIRRERALFVAPSSAVGDEALVNQIQVTAFGYRMMKLMCSGSGGEKREVESHIFLVVVGRSRAVVGKL